MFAQWPVDPQLPGDPPEVQQPGAGSAVASGTDLTSLAMALLSMSENEKTQTTEEDLQCPESDATDPSPSEKYLLRKERLRRKRLASAGTYGSLLRMAHKSQHDEDDGRAASVSRICADQGLALKEVTLVGEGSFARVWCGQAASAAYGLEPGDRVALKVIRERFRGALATQKWTEREIQAMMIPEHGHLVYLFKTLADGSNPVLCMEFCPGGSVHEVIHSSQRRHVPTMAQRIKIGLDIARGMAHLHSHSVLHRDLKPSNVMLLCELDCGARQPHAKVVDFGLARLLDAAGAESGDLTLDVGSPVYRAPELCSSEGTVGHYDFKADVFSFAVLANELLTEERPYAGFPQSGRPRLVLAIISGARPSQARMPGDTPPEFASIIADAWSADPCDRPDFDVTRDLLEDCHRASFE